MRPEPRVGWHVASPGSLVSRTDVVIYANSEAGRPVAHSSAVGIVSCDNGGTERFVTFGVTAIFSYRGSGNVLL